jgi:hypothetical protein
MRCSARKEKNAAFSRWLHSLRPMPVTGSLLTCFSDSPQPAGCGPGLRTTPPCRGGTRPSLRCAPAVPRSGSRSSAPRSWPSLHAPQTSFATPPVTYSPEGWTCFSRSYGVVVTRAPHPAGGPIPRRSPSQNAHTSSSSSCNQATHRWTRSRSRPGPWPRRSACCLERIAEGVEDPGEDEPAPPENPGGSQKGKTPGPAQSPFPADWHAAWYADRSGVCRRGYCSPAGGAADCAGAERRGRRRP